MRLGALSLTSRLLVLFVATAYTSSHPALVSSAADQACTSDETTALAAIAAAQSGLLHNCESESGYALYPFSSYPMTAQQSVVCVGRSCPNVIANFQQAASLPECLVTVDGQQMTTAEFLDSICDSRTPTPTPTPTPISGATTAPTSTPAPSCDGSSPTETPTTAPAPSSPTATTSAPSGSTPTTAPSATSTSDNETGNSSTAPTASASTSSSGSSGVNVSASGSEDLSIEPLSSSSSSASLDMASSSGSDAGSAAETPEPTIDGASRSAPGLLLTALVVGSLAVAGH